MLKAATNGILYFYTEQFDCDDVNKLLPSCLDGDTQCKWVGVQNTCPTQFIEKVQDQDPQFPNPSDFENKIKRLGKAIYNKWKQSGALVFYIYK